MVAGEYRRGSACQYVRNVGGGRSSPRASLFVCEIGTLLTQSGRLSILPRASLFVCEIGTLLRVGGGGRRYSASPPRGWREKKFAG